MHTVHLKTSGDEWLNSQQVNQELSNLNDPTQLVCFDTGAEGISLRHSGILDTINHWVQATNHNPDCVVINSPNNFEITPYQNLNQSAGNHFFAMSQHYQQTVAEPRQNAKLFGLFLGRHTEQRNIIARDCFNNYQQHFLFSILKSSFRVNPWSPELHDIGSIDDLYVRDQYSLEFNTNASLLKFYPEFCIELVVETCCLGETFFPTEKTIRPLLGQRPVIVFGPRHFLKNLQRLGFQTYAQCWDESYDEFESADRWRAMQVVIDHIVQHGYDKNLACNIARYNSEHLKQWHEYTTPRDMPRVIHD